MKQDLLLKEILDALPVPVIQLLPDGNIAYQPANFSCACINPTHLLDLIHRDDHAEATATLASLSNNGPATFEVRLNDEPAKQRHALLSLTRMQASAGGIILAQFTDITAQTLRERDIALRESRWNSALVGSLSGVWDQNFATGEMYGSETWRSMRGMAPDDPIEANLEEWLTLVHPDDRAHTVHCLQKQTEGDPAYAAFQYRERHKDGHWIWIECRGACIERDENGKPLRIVGTDTDVTERKASESEMERMSRHLKLALEASQVGVFEVDFETGVTTWDDRLYEIFGIDKSMPIIVDGLWESRVHPDDLSRVLGNVSDKMDKLEPFTEEYRVVLPDGSLRYVRARSLPFIDIDGKRKMIGVNWDVTADIALRNELERAKTQTEARNQELEQARINIEHNALHDYLTDLPNRRYLDEVLTRGDLFTGQASPGLAILHIDLDRFKQINDTLGHRTGDVMLKYVAGLLRKASKKKEFVARIGGDEFVLLSPFTGDTRKIESMAKRLIKQLKQPILHEGHECRIGASIGIACGIGADMDYKQLLLNADIALYNAKKRGRNRFEFFSSDTQDWLINTKRVSDEILTALERDEFIPYYQFQFCAQTLDITGVETLARWNHSTEGILTPDRFLAIAEDLDAVSAIDSIILKKALVDFSKWKAAGLSIPKVSVNVSARRLHDPALSQSLDGLKIEAGTLAFELLESIFLDESDDITLHNLKKLRELGINIEIDDFGTGHASIISLLKVSPHTLKIDRELVRLIPQSNEQRKLLGSIIDIGRSLGIRVVAEGVESAEHIHILQDMGCDALQGFALCRPLPAEAVADFVAAQAWRTVPFQTQRSTRASPGIAPFK